MIKPLHQGGFFSENRNQNNQVFATGEIPGTWEIFYVHYENDSLIKIQSSTGNYLFVTPHNIIRTTTNKDSSTSFVLTPYKQYYKITTPEGKGLIVDKNSMEVKVSQDKNPEIIEIEHYATLPLSWFSLLELNWQRFLFQLSFFIGSIFIFFKLFKKLIPKNQLSYKTILILGFILLFVIFDTKPWKDNKVIANDVLIYYEYLPATFIFKDLSFNFITNLPEDFKGAIWVNENEITGRKYPKMSMGMSFVYLPFFLIGHTLAILSDNTAYGFSTPYQMSITLGCWLYVFLGLFYLRKILLLYFNDTVTSFTLFSIILATNLFYYTTVAPGMSHAYSFCLITLFIWFTIKWHTNKKLLPALFIGLTIGLISLIRPTNILIALFFIFYDIKSIADLKRKISIFLDKKTHLLVIITCALVVWFPQMLFWKYATDNWLFFSYGNERFYFNNPHIIDGLFSYRKGWLIYTPIMLFSLFGIIFLFRAQKKLFLPLLIFIPLNIYIVYSWWCWYYGGSFSSRPMVDSYGLMAIPLASFFAYFDKKTSYLKSISLFIIFLTISLNLFQTQQTKTCLHWADMTKKAYWNNFTTLGWPQGYDDMLKAPDNENLIKGLDERD